MLFDRLLPTAELRLSNDDQSQPLLSILDNPHSTGEPEQITGEQLLMFITDSVLPYLHSTQRQLGKQSTTSNGGNAELALKHLAWLMDIGSTMCWLVSSLPAATISQLTGTPGGECDAAVDDPALSVAGQLIISLQEAYDELVPILINYLSSAVAQQTNDRYSLLARLHLLGLFRCLLDKCYECPLLLSSCGDIQLLQSDDSINMKATGLFHEYSRIWMLLIERHPIADGERRLAIDAPLLIDLVHFYGDDRGELQPLHSIINRFADSADTTSLEFAHASIQQLVREPISGDWLINLRPPSSLDSQRSWSTQTLTTTDQQTRIASQIDTPAVDLQLDSLITAVRDIFPDLKEEFVQTILLHHDRDLERTIAALCDQSSSTEQSSRAGHSILQPQLQQQQQQGRAATAVVDYATQKVLDDRNDWGNIAAFKANTLQASGDYAAQIEFDDERDDADELGDNDLFDPWMRSTTVTNSSTDASAAAVVARNKSLLFRAYTRDPLLFERKQRGSRARQQLRQETGFSDEQIEGWRIMLERNPLKQDLLNQFAVDDILAHRIDNQLKIINGDHSGGNHYEQKASHPQQKESRGGHRRRGGSNRKVGHSKKVARGFGPVAD